MTVGFIPICTIIAGPNGAGKSTIVADLAPPGEAVNADDYARRLNPLNPAAASAAAGRAVLHRLDSLIGTRQSFHFETTLSGKQPLDLMVRARAAGYRVDMAFVLLRSRELHVARVRTRVAEGGHDIPVTTILRRYERTLDNLAASISVLDQLVIFDNTGDVPLVLCRIDQKTIVASGLDRNDEFHQRVVAKLSAGLGIPIEAVLNAPV